MAIINPSVHGWIDKLFTSQKDICRGDIEPESYYENLRSTGFLYGHVVSFGDDVSVVTKGWLEEERSKTALLLALYRMYCLTSGKSDTVDFITRTVAFYRHLNPGGFNLLKKILPGAPASYNLEELIGQRVNTNQDIVSKNFSNIVTNALLFVDVLAFQKYLQLGEVPEKYLPRFEEAVVNIVSLALAAKTVKSPHDDLLLKLFEASVRYTKFSRSGISNPEDLKLDYFVDPLEKFYFIDLAGLALWTDGVIENEEAYFLYKLGESLGIDDEFVARSIIDTNAFISHHRNEIPYFNHVSPVKNFYDHMTQMVVTLITRNRNRLVKEISQSGELMKLLAQSTQRELDAKEKKKVKRQLLDICKTVPSLTIFLLPGGSLLLPILIKFIPTLLPSAFNENTDID